MCQSWSFEIKLQEKQEERMREGCDKKVQQVSQAPCAEDSDRFTRFRSINIHTTWFGNRNREHMTPNQMY